MPHHFKQINNNNNVLGFIMLLLLQHFSFAADSTNFVSLISQRRRCTLPEFKLAERKKKMGPKCFENEKSEETPKSNLLETF